MARKVVVAEEEIEVLKETKVLIEKMLIEDRNNKVAKIQSVIDKYEAANNHVSIKI